MAKDAFRRGSGPMWYLALVVLVFALYSLTIASSTADKCDVYGGDKTWQVMPPRWECNGRRGG
jgi:hypothetical protein